MRRREPLLVLAAIAVLAGAAPASADQLVTWNTTSRYVDIAKVKFNGPPPGETRLPPGLRVNVRLPDGYDGKRRFPVLYLLHGHGDTFAHMANAQRGNVREVAKASNAIIVMPEGATGWYTNWWNGGKRSEPAWEDHYLQELMPFVERRLAIRRGRRWHAIAGISMGGGGAAYLATQRPGYFGSIATFSGATSTQRPEWPQGMGSQGEAYEDVFGDPKAFYATGHNPTALTDNLASSRVFVSVGDGVAANPDELRNAFGAVAEADLARHAEDFTAAAQRSKAVQVTSQSHQGIHDWPYWRVDLADALRWNFFKAVPERPSQWTYTTTLRRGQAWDLRFSFAEPPTTLVTFKRDGRRLTATGSGTVAIRTADGSLLRAALPFDRVLPRPRRRR